MKSRLLLYNLLVGLAATEVRAGNDAIRNRGQVPGTHDVTRGPEYVEAVIWERVQYVVVERESRPKRVILESIPEPTPALARQPQLPRIPQPTAAPRKRQDQGQIDALSGEIQRLSSSFNSASSSAQSLSQASQSISQSADQAVRSAQQDADQAKQAASRSQSSASSAASQASQQADDRISRASSSMNSQVSANLASVQSSASSVISRAQESARSSAASAMDVAASQIAGVRGDANSLVAQVQSNSISAMNLAIIVSASIVGAVLLTSAIAFCIFRHRRQHRRRRERERERESPRSDSDRMNEKMGYEKPIAVQGVPPEATPSGARFNPFSGGTYPMDKLKLPGSPPPFADKKDPSVAVGLATSDYSDLEKRKSAAKAAASQGQGSAPDVFGVGAQSFRLQKPPDVQRAETVRIIRVSSKKQMRKDERPITLSTPPVPTRRRPPLNKEVLSPGANKAPPADLGQPTQAPPAPEEIRPPPPVYAMQPPPTPPPSQPLPTPPPMVAPRHVSQTVRFSVASSLADEAPSERPPSSSPKRMTTTTTMTTDAPPPRPASRDGNEPEAETESSAVPARGLSLRSALANQGMGPQSRPTSRGRSASTSRKRGGDMSRSRSRSRGDGGGEARRPPLPTSSTPSADMPAMPAMPAVPETGSSRPRTPKAGPAFATFPTIRPSPPNAPRPSSSKRMTMRPGVGTAGPDAGARS